jgi:hypothetical protein
MRIQEFNYNVNLLQAILWQYDEAVNLLSLINKKQEWYNKYQTQFWTDWYNNVFNILTANQFGLSVWSYILNVPLYLDNEVEDPLKPIWGFNNNSSYPVLENTYLNFENGNFSTKGQIINLTLEEQRFLLRLRYFQLCTNGIVSAINPDQVVTGINEFLNYLCLTSNIGYSGTIYALDGLDMTMTYIITDAGFPQELLNVIQILDLFPRPTGVLLKIHINYGRQFGFNAGTFGNYENTNLNFENGNFINPFITPIPPGGSHHEIMVDESGNIMISETGEVMITQ